MFGWMSARGLGTLKFIDGTIKLKISRNSQSSLLPSIIKMYQNGDYIFQRLIIQLNPQKIVKG